MKCCLFELSYLGKVTFHKPNPICTCNTSWDHVLGWPIIFYASYSAVQDFITSPCRTPESMPQGEQISALCGGCFLLQPSFPDEQSQMRGTSPGGMAWN